MMAVDTSALMAIVLDEPQAGSCIAALASEGEILISAGTIAEALIVARRRHVGEEMTALIDGLGAEVVAITAAAARRIAETYDRWGKGLDPAGLNLGDCFAYVVAKDRDCRLLYVGDDFSRTDIASVL